MKYNFVNPKAPKYKKGVLVIHSDDGSVNEYLNWHPVYVRKNIQYPNQWFGHKTVAGNSAISTAMVGTTGYMTKENLIELVNHGWEMLSHGRHHISIGAHQLSVSATTGDTVISMPGAMMFSQGVGEYSLLIQEGNTNEVVTPVSIEGVDGESSYGVGKIHISTPLKNSYTTNAKVMISDESAELLFQGGINEAKEMGFELNNHVYTWHSGGDHNPNIKAEEWSVQYFNSGRGLVSQSVVNEKGNMKLGNLVSVLNSQITNAQTNTLLDATAENDSLMIFYGHGEGTQERINQLENLIDEALKRGIRILTHNNALKYYELV